MECEVYVEVVVSGPKEQLHTYMNWIAQTEECICKTRKDSRLDKQLLQLTQNASLDSTWQFSSSNILTKVKVAKLRDRGVFKFTVNYFLQEGLTVDDMKMFKTIYETAAYKDLMESFNAMPSVIACECPDLVLKNEWGSYFIEDKAILTTKNELNWLI